MATKAPNDRQSKDYMIFDLKRRLKLAQERQERAMSTEEWVADQNTIDRCQAMLTAAEEGTL